MKRFSNSIQGPDSCCIMLYGEVNDWGENKAADLVRDLLQAELDNKKVDVHINSIGGEVYTGIAIFNALRNSKADVTIYIDCIAASIAAVVASCGKPVKICSNGRMMIHSIEGGAYGKVEEIEHCISEMHALETLLCDIYSTRTGKTAEEIRALYFDGAEHWLNAEQALSLGFVDEIYDDPDPLPVAILQNRAAAVICDAYTSKYFNKLNQQVDMIEKFKTRPAFTSCADEDAIINKVEELETKAAEVETLRAENAKLKAEIAAFKKEKEEKTEVENIAQVDSAIEDGRIKKEQKETFVSLLRTDRERTQSIINALKPTRRVVNQLGKGADTISAWDAAMDKIKNQNKR
ncbi:MAG: Clp protease ClpP [Alistipes sp.]